MDIKVGDKFEDKNEGIILIIIDKIKGDQIFHHTIGRYNSIPNSEIKRIEIFEWLIISGTLKKI